jgi:surfactin synthase thioesterase subunit
MVSELRLVYHGALQRLFRTLSEQRQAMIALRAVQRPPQKSRLSPTLFGLSFSVGVRVR